MVFQPAAKGIDVRSTTAPLVFSFWLTDSSGNDVTSGTTTLEIYKIGSAGTFQAFDFSTNAFTAGTPTTPTASMTHQTAGGMNSGIWTYPLTVLTGFTSANTYFAKARNSSASPPNPVRWFQFGSAEGDLQVTASGYLETDVEQILGTAATPPPTASAIATAVFTDSLSGADFATVGSFGALVKANLDTNIGSRLAASSYSAPDNTDIATILTGVTAIYAGMGTTANQTSLLNLLQADRVIDTTTDPTQFHEVFFAAGTDTVLLTKRLFDINGAKLNSTSTVVGQARQ